MIKKGTDFKSAPAGAGGNFDIRNEEFLHGVYVIGGPEGTDNTNGGDGDPPKRTEFSGRENFAKEPNPVTLENLPNSNNANKRKTLYDRLILTSKDGSGPDSEKNPKGFGIFVNTSDMFSPFWSGNFSPSALDPAKMAKSILGIFELFTDELKSSKEVLSSPKRVSSGYPDAKGNITMELWNVNKTRIPAILIRDTVITKEAYDTIPKNYYNVLRIEY